MSARVVGPRVELARLVAGREGHVAEELEAGVGARGRGDVGAARPGAVGEPVDLAGGAELGVVPLGLDAQAGGEELGLQGLLRRQPALRRLGGEAADRHAAPRDLEQHASPDRR